LGLHPSPDYCARLLNSAARSGWIVPPSVPIPDKRQISGGNLDRLSHTTPNIQPVPLMDIGLRDHMPARLTPYVSDPVLVHRLARLLHASFSPSLAGAPLRFAMTSLPSGCQQDFHRRSCRTCSAYKENAPQCLPRGEGQQRHCASNVKRGFRGRCRGLEPGRSDLGAFHRAGVLRHNGYIARSNPLDSVHSNADIEIAL
jgi:hypothetical protein